jgi:HSP20 family protein
MLVRWYPVSGSRRLGRYDYNPFHWQAFNGSYGEGYIRPRADLLESENDYRITVEIPGVDKDDFNISINEGQLTVSGEKKVDQGNDDERGYRLLERVSGKFHRVFELPGDVDEKGVKADYKNGVLAVSLPKSEKAKPREIPIRNGK